MLCEDLKNGKKIGIKINSAIKNRVLTFND